MAPKALWVRMGGSRVCALPGWECLRTHLGTVRQTETGEVKRDTGTEGVLSHCSGVLGGWATPQALVLGTCLEGTAESSGAWQREGSALA